MMGIEMLLKSLGFDKDEVMKVAEGYKQLFEEHNKLLRKISAQLDRLEGIESATVIGTATHIPEANNEPSQQRRIGTKN